MSIQNVQRSENLGKLGKALSVAQGLIKGALRGSVNPTFNSRYADLASVWDACREHLAANCIAVVQLPSSDGPLVTVTTMLIHESGEWIAGELTLTTAETTYQESCKAITTARRYSLAAMVGVAPQGDDDDGEGAEGRGPEGGQPARRTGRNRVDYARRDGKISEAEQKALLSLCGHHNRTLADLQQIIGRHGFKKNGDITPDKWDVICNEIKGVQITE